MRERKGSRSKLALETPQNRADYAARMDPSHDENLSSIRLYLFRAVSDDQPRNIPFAVISRSACDLSLAASMESVV
jgi:hypothetical protein